MTDKVVYETKGRPIYVIQLETENHEWRDTPAPHFRILGEAINYLNKQEAYPYPYRIVERKK